MDRRDFMKLAALSGLAVVTPLSSELNAAEDQDKLYSSGKFFIALVASGGWDPTNLCDPKGKDSEPDISQSYETAAIKKAGEIAYAPLIENQAFFEKYQKDLLVINGIDTITNGHRAAERYVWTGHLQSKVHPTFAAFYAAKKSEGLDLPLGYLSYGAYSNTGQLIPVSRLQGITTLSRLGNPGYKNGDLKQPFRSEFARSKIEAALANRRQNFLDAQNLPKVKGAVSTMYAAQLSSSKLKELTRYIPEGTPKFPEVSRRLASTFQKIAIALTTCKSGICVSANINLTGFDTHSKHEEMQNARLSEYTKSVTFLMETAEKMGIRERIILMMSSEFSRTPVLNDKKGKDHWPVASAMFMGPGIRGNRVIGGTSSQKVFIDEKPIAAQSAMGFDIATMKAIPFIPKEKTFRIRPQHIHTALRKLTEIEASQEATDFKLADQEEIDFFS